jgi:anti-sigma factor RsiW
MSVVPRSVVCDRVRAQISLRLDGELSQLESLMLASHLARCDECTEFEASVVAVTHDLRAAPLEPVPHPVVVHRHRRRAPVARMQVGIAAAMAVAVLGAVTQILPREPEPAFAAPKQYATYSQLTREVQQIIADGRAFSKRGGSEMPL